MDQQEASGVSKRMHHHRAKNRLFSETDEDESVQEHGSHWQRHKHMVSRLNYTEELKLAWS